MKNLTEFEETVFEYLDILRETGVTNMFGASPYIENAFDVDRRESKELLMKWMNTFSERHPED